MEAVDDDVLAALRTCYDPEIPVNIVDLGLVYDVQVLDGAVEVRMTLTSRFCPLAEHITGGIEETLREVEGVEAATVRLVWEPVWTPARMTPAGRAELGLP